jgi:nitroreductase
MNVKNLVRRLIGPDLVEHLKSLRDRSKASVLGVLSVSSMLSALYYAVASSEFRAEQQAVLRGRVRFLRDRRKAGYSIYLLRRNIHRLEKGLIMRPARAVFARDYIAETVDAYKAFAAISVMCGGSSDLRWATTVLDEYFRRVTADPEICRIRAQYLAARSGTQLPVISPKLERKTYPNPEVHFDQFFALARVRRSVRWYQDRSVPRDLLEKAVVAASMAPSACNRQPYRFRIFDDPRDARVVGGIPGGTSGFDQNFQCVVVLTGFLRAYSQEKDRHLIYIDGALAAMSFMYALETLGLSSCPINWPDIRSTERRLRSFMDIEEDERVVMFISVGYADPDGGVPTSQKKELTEVRTFERLSVPAERLEEEVALT